MRSRDLDQLTVHSDIEQARTLPGWLYDDPRWFARLCERVFPRTWHGWPLDTRPTRASALTPWTLLPGALDEPLLLTHDGSALRCVSNVCTHRGAVLVDRPTSAGSIRCRYHGRRFALDGRMTSAPGFEACPGFPTAADDLSATPLGRWRRLLFTSLDPATSFDAWLDPVRARVGTVVPQDMRFDENGSHHFELQANWALYCDNYLEGFHIPFVHPLLNRALDFDGYRTELFASGSLQLGVAQPDELAFDLPRSHPDHGTRVAAYYFWLFPSTMINVYPWGMSINLVLPRGPARTKVVYLRYVWDESTYDTGAGSQLDTVEYEDEDVVHSCGRGVRSRLYDRGRYSPTHERGVHHFHRLLLAAARDPRP